MQEVWYAQQGADWMRKHPKKVLYGLPRAGESAGLAWRFNGEDIQAAPGWHDLVESSWYCMVDVFEDVEFAAPGADPRHYPRPPVANCHGQAIDGRDFVFSKSCAFLVFGPPGKLGRCSRELMPEPMRLMLAETVTETVGRVHWCDLEPLAIASVCGEELDGAVNVAGHSYARGELANALSLIVDDIDADDFFLVARMKLREVETLRLHRWPWTIWLAALSETVEAEALPVVSC